MKDTVLLFVAAVLAGALNSVAGGGSFLVISGAYVYGSASHPGECDKHSGTVAGSCGQHLWLSASNNG